MTRLNYGPAKKFLYNCQYLKGKEIDIKRRNGRVTKGTVTGFGACGSVYGKIEMWAKVKDNYTGQMMQVDLMALYRAVPFTTEDKKLLVKEMDAPAAEESVSIENTAEASGQ